MRRLLPLAIAGLCLLAACGSDGDGAATSTTTSTLPGTPADRRISGAWQLVGSDPPPRFQEITPGLSEMLDLTESAATVTACDFYRTAEPTPNVGGRAGGYQRGTTIVNASLKVFADVEDAQALMDLYRDPKMVDCLDGIYSADGATVDVSPIAPNDFGDDRLGYRITLGGQTGAEAKAVDVIVVRVGRAVFSVNVAGTAADSAEFQSTVIPKVVDRMRAAGA
jgi:hypothetical protein